MSTPQQWAASNARVSVRAETGPAELGRGVVVAWQPESVAVDMDGGGAMVIPVSRVSELGETEAPTEAQATAVVALGSGTKGRDALLALRAAGLDVVVRERTGPTRGRGALGDVLGGLLGGVGRRS